MRLELRAVTAEDTRAVGEAVAPLLEPDDTIVLTGELGAGKTTLTQGIARGLGIGDAVSSPTFVLVHEYDGRLPLTHVDVYRLERIQDVVDLGLDERPGAVTIVEWGDAVEDVLPSERLRVELTSEDPSGASDVRRLSISAVGDSWTARWDALARALGAWEVAA